MLKSIFAVALSLILAATPALARDDSWYIGAEAGGTIISNADIDVTNSAGVFANNAYSINTEPGFDVGGILGYDFGWFRLEADVSYRRAEVTGIEQNLGSRLPIAGTVTGTSVNYNPGGPNGNPPGNPFQWNGAQGSMRILAFMANGLLDFGDDDGFQGYIGGGVGIARTSFDGIRVTDAAPVITDDSDSGFAWQLVAGVRYPLSRNFDIGVKYRFFNQDDVGTNSFYSTSDETDVRSHSALVTLTYNFGSSPPVCLDGTPVPPGGCMIDCPDPNQNISYPEGGTPNCPIPPTTTPCPPPNGQISYPIGADEAAHCPCPVLDLGPVTIFFDTNEYVIDRGYGGNEAAIQTLQMIAEIYNCRVSRIPPQPLNSIVVAGHTDRVDDNAYNDALSRRRACSIVSHLSGLRIPEEVLQPYFFGEIHNRIATVDGQEQQDNRRVEIFLDERAVPDYVTDEDRVNCSEVDMTV
ncbi:MAG: OmpA family protein [Parasphingopyxis sp.]